MPEKNNNNHNTDENVSQGKVPLQTRHKIAISFSLLLLVVTSAFWLLFQNELNRSLKEYSDILGTTLAEQTATSIRELVLVNDLLGLNVVLTQLVSDNNIAYVSVYDVDNRQLSSAGQRQSSLPDSANSYSSNISVQEAIAGSVQIELDYSAIASSQSRMRNLFILVLAISLILVVTTAFALASRIIAPLQLLADLIDEKAANDNIEDPSHQGDETSRLKQSVENLLLEFNGMEEQLLETGVWQGGDKYQDPSRLTATILVIKVVNINTAIELLHPATLANLLREYIFYINQAARLYGGSLQRLSGDSVLLCFDSGTCDDQHSINALHCAGLFQALMKHINKKHKSTGGQILEFRMAIHSGDVFLAPELSQEADDNVLGKTIDISYFLCKQASPNQLVISESAFSQAREFENIEAAGQNEVNMPADNVAFMAYILTNNFIENTELIRKQCDHILSLRKTVES